MDADAGPDFAVELLDGDPPVLVVRGELDVETSVQLREGLIGLTERGDPIVRMDLSGVSFIDSVGLSVLVQARKQYAAEARDLQLRPVSARVRATIDIAGASAFLGIDETDVTHD
ncbi:MAG TPA: STAS domain-containing protein [Acidimicrobiia bacterium]|nr:STAS domain-containing protein [Acidimicrobiia bacterium]